VKDVFKIFLPPARYIRNNHTCKNPYSIHLILTVLIQSFVGSHYSDDQESRTAEIMILPQLNNDKQWRNKSPVEARPF